ncbi:hypothetical protein RB653_000053 [Dictyostelium firmibasis]|uniref:EF-hand domain-containing protein n=1 Tax=Dictyostelium firmibasis TaxID=79012 RepID=A0AAN7Z0W4_9MYCE
MVQFKISFLKDCDLNKDGKVTYREIYVGLSKQDKKISVPTAMEIFKSYDENKDGEISIEEFTKKATFDYLSGVCEKVKKELPLIKQFDKNKDGLLSYDELTEAFKSDKEYCKFSKEWVDWSFDSIGKKKTDKLNDIDALTIMAFLSVEEDN